LSHFNGEWGVGWVHGWVRERHGALGGQLLLSCTAVATQTRHLQAAAPVLSSLHCHSQQHADFNCTQRAHSRTHPRLIYRILGGLANKHTQTHTPVHTTLVGPTGTRNGTDCDSIRSGPTNVLVRTTHTLLAGSGSELSGRAAVLSLSHQVRREHPAEAW
jgi:hypothetical protein